MGIKISNLPIATTPLVGDEPVVLNQDGDTFTTLLSNVKEYVGIIQGNQVVIGSSVSPVLTATSGTSTGSFLSVLLNGQSLKIPLYS